MASTKNPSKNPRRARRRRAPAAIAIGLLLVGCGAALASCLLSFDDYPLPTSTPDAGPVQMKGSFASGAVQGSAHGRLMRGQLLWHGAVRGQGGGYVLEGALR